LTDRYETTTSYKLETLPQDFVEKEMRGVAAFQIEVTQIEANYKLSQNRDEESYRNIVDHLEQRMDDYSHEIAKAMKQNRP
jgi:transcriptional regulator